MLSCLVMLCMFKYVSLLAARRNTYFFSPPDPLSTQPFVFILFIHFLFPLHSAFSHTPIPPHLSLSTYLIPTQLFNFIFFFFFFMIYDPYPPLFFLPPFTLCFSSFALSFLLSSTLPQCHPLSPPFVSLI